LARPARRRPGSSTGESRPRNDPLLRSSLGRISTAAGGGKTRAPRSRRCLKTREAELLKRSRAVPPAVFPVPLPCHWGVDCEKEGTLKPKRNRRREAVVSN